MGVRLLTEDEELSAITHIKSGCQNHNCHIFMMQSPVSPLPLTCEPHPMSRSLSSLLPTPSHRCVM